MAGIVCNRTFFGLALLSLNHWCWGIRKTPALTVIADWLWSIDICSLVLLRVETPGHYCAICRGVSYNRFSFKFVLLLKVRDRSNYLRSEIPGEKTWCLICQYSGTVRRGITDDKVTKKWLILSNINVNPPKWDALNLNFVNWYLLYPLNVLD